MKQRFLETNNGLSALLVNKSDYDGHWVSSLTHSLSKGLPDTELISLSERVDLIREIRRVSQKPIMVDCDTGGKIEHFNYNSKWLLEAGADYLVIEDKKGFKQNSLKNADHELEEVDEFCKKIKARFYDTKVIARLESLIAKHSIYEALLRAEAYLKAGAWGILIHSKQKVQATEVIEFAEKFREKYDNPLIAIPSTYKLPEKNPFDITIEANQLTRVSYEAMEKYIQGKPVKKADIDKIVNLI